MQELILVIIHVTRACMRRGLTKDLMFYAIYLKIIVMNHWRTMRGGIAVDSSVRTRSVIIIECIYKKVKVQIWNNKALSQR